jgi:hypothetical protein
MKTGRLLKFHRPAGEIQAYLYREDGIYHAAVYLMSADGAAGRDAVHHMRGATEAGLERDVRSWVESRYPRS